MDKDGTDGKQGNPQGTPGQTPNATPGTSDSTEKTYTETELQKLISDVKAGEGRKVATLTKTVEDLKAESDARAKALEAKELEGIRNDPAALRSYQSRKALETKTNELTVKEADLTAREAAIAAKEAEANKATVAATIARLATEHGIEAARLTELGTEDVTVLEKFAQALSGKVPAVKPAVRRVDSNRSKGGTNLEGMSPRDKIQFGIDESRRRKGG